MRCTFCGMDNPSAAVICGGCGYGLKGGSPQPGEIAVRKGYLSAQHLGEFRALRRRVERRKARVESPPDS